jgi:gamma-glutamyltranspeptidase/glutathione hydrolase
MVATSQPLAAQAGLRLLLAGGNAIDAAVATAATLGVVEPFSTGIGGDAFALVYMARSGEVLALNASGRSPAAWTLEEALRRCGADGGTPAIPITGGLSITVPGTVDGWASIIERCGRMSLAEVLEPAISYAEQGFPVSPLIAQSWEGLVPKLRDGYGGEAFLVGGRAPRAGEIFRQPELGRTMRAIAEGGRAAFYTGPIAEALAAAAQAAGSYLTADDLAAHRSTWETPIEVRYRGLRVLECPPNGHGLVALLALNTLRDDDIAALGWGTPATLHLQIEALRAAFADGLYYVADPEHAPAPLEALLGLAYGSRRRGMINRRRAGSYRHERPIEGDTIYLTTADAEGNVVSFINSLYHGFGSGVAAPGTGVMLQNRGALFALDPAHPNCLVPGKRPYHTIIPAMALGADGRPRISFGVMGGFMQPQGHVQVLQNMLDFGYDPQQALDAPRFCIVEGRGAVLAEPGVPEGSLAALAALGHDIRYAGPGERGSFGGGQIIAVDPNNGVYMAGSDPRKDGCAVGF